MEERVDELLPWRGWSSDDEVATLVVTNLLAVGKASLGDVLADESEFVIVEQVDDRHCRSPGILPQVGEHGIRGPSPHGCEPRTVPEGCAGPASQTPAAGIAQAVKKKRLKRELRALAERQDQLEQASRVLAAHSAVIAVAVRTPERVPHGDLDASIAGVHELNGRYGGHS